MNKTYINLGLFALGGVIMWFIAFPLYAGSGQNILNRKSVIDFRKESINKEEELALAVDLKKRAAQETTAFQSINPDLKEKVEQMIFNKVDIPRLFNDISILVKASGLKLDDISYSKGTNPDGVVGLNSYKINLGLTGSYLDLRDLMKSMQGSLQLYRISSIFLTSVKSSDSRNSQDGGSSTNSQKFNITFDVYEFKN